MGQNVLRVDSVVRVILRRAAVDMIVIGII